MGAFTFDDVDARNLIDALVQKFENDQNQKTAQDLKCTYKKNELQVIQPYPVNALFKHNDTDLSYIDKMVIYAPANFVHADLNLLPNKIFCDRKLCITGGGGIIQRNKDFYIKDKVSLSAIALGAFLSGGFENCTFRVQRSIRTDYNSSYVFEARGHNFKNVKICGFDLIELVLNRTMTYDEFVAGVTSRCIDGVEFEGTPDITITQCYINNGESPYKYVFGAEYDRSTSTYKCDKL